MRPGDPPSPDTKKAPHPPMKESAALVGEVRILAYAVKIDGQWWRFDRMFDDADI